MNDKVFSDDSGHIEVLEQHSLTITQFANACKESQKFHRKQEEWQLKNTNISLRWKLG